MRKLVENWQSVVEKGAKGEKWEGGRGRETERQRDREREGGVGRVKVKMAAVTPPPIGPPVEALWLFPSRDFHFSFTILWRFCKISCPFIAILKGLFSLY